jgi:hypothetical protein
MKFKIIIFRPSNNQWKNNLEIKIKTNKKMKQLNSNNHVQIKYLKIKQLVNKMKL